MKNVLQYFNLIASVVEGSRAESAEVEFDQIDQATGLVDGVLYFHDGSRLELTEAVAIHRRRPVKRAYRYEYVRAGEAVFRYDNAAHHPDLPNFPHHKHVGQERLPATEPTLSQVLEEVTALMQEAAEEPPPTPRRRRQSKR
jgi:cytochrome c peroxidase